MSQLAELVKRDYDKETKAIKDAGNIWAMGAVFAIGFAVLWGIDFLCGKPWDGREIAFMIIGMSFIHRAWERHEVATRLRHEREIRIEAKLDALLGLIDIKD
jgi:hypothetical protein